MMARIVVYVYRCTNGACRYILRRTGMRKSMIPCPICGSQMRIIKEEKELIIFIYFISNLFFLEK